MILKQFYLNCLAHASYLIGDEQSHTAAVVDPQRDVDQYLAFAAGHGLLAHILLILDDSSPSALSVDTVQPRSAARLHAVFVDAWPRLAGRIVFDERPLASVPLHHDDLVVASHPCGALADAILDAAAAARARAAVLPCCHDFAVNDAGSLSGWLDEALAIDVTRVVRLEQQGYRVWTQTIPRRITPKNHLLLGEPLTTGSGLKA